MTQWKIIFELERKKLNSVALFFCTMCEKHRKDKVKHLRRDNACIVDIKNSGYVSF